jgi:tetratricopeptide (TPR) repeat protein
MVRLPKFSKRSDHPEGTITQQSSGDQSPNIVADTVSVTYIQQLSRPPKVSALHQLPARPAVFTGRDTEVSALEDALTHQRVSGGAMLAGVQGTGGVGKTALAIVLAHRLKDRYPDAQLYLNLRGAGESGDTYNSAMNVPAVTPAEAMRTVIQSFKPDAELPPTLAGLTPIYRAVLAEAGSVLLVLDNAANAEQVQPLLPPPNCLLLVTSRTQFQLPGLARRNLDYLLPEKSRELLLALSPSLKGYESEAADLCGHLPLALQVFARAVNDKKLTPVNELIQRLREGTDRLAPVDAAFEVSYELLDQELRRKWTLLAVFPTNFDLSAAAAVWEKSREVQLSTDDLSEVRDAMQALFNASLVEWNESNGRFRLHDLVRRFCDSKLSNGERDAGHLRHARYYRDVLEAASELLKHVDNNTDIREGVKISQREELNLHTGINSLWKRSDRDANVVLISLINLFSRSGNLRSYRPETVMLVKRQLDAAHIARDRHAEAMALCNLGSAYLNDCWGSGDRKKAIELFKQAMPFLSEIDDNQVKADALNDYVFALSLAGNKKDALAEAEKALPILDEIDRDRANEMRGQIEELRSSISSSSA